MTGFGDVMAGMNQLTEVTSARTPSYDCFYVFLVISAEQLQILKGVQGAWRPHP